MFLINIYTIEKKRKEPVGDGGRERAIVGCYCTILSIYYSATTFFSHCFLHSTYGGICLLTRCFLFVKTQRLSTCKTSTYILNPLQKKTVPVVERDTRSIHLTVRSNGRRTTRKSKTHTIHKPSSINFPVEELLVSSTYNFKNGMCEQRPSMCGEYRDWNSSVHVFHRWRIRNFLFYLGEQHTYH